MMLPFVVIFKNLLTYYAKYYPFHIVLGKQKEENSFQNELKLREVQCSNAAFKLLQVVLEVKNYASALKS